MGYAVTHILLPLIAVDFYRHYIAKKKFSRSFSLIAGIAGLLPDIDIPISWAISFFTGNPIWLHRTYTHAFIFVVAFFLIAAVIKYSKKQHYFMKFSKRQVYLFFIMLGIGWSFHIILDCALAADYMLAWIPFIAPLGFCPEWSNPDILAGIDAILLVVWLIHEEFKHKIKDYV